MEFKSVNNSYTSILIKPYLEIEVHCFHKFRSFWKTLEKNEIKTKFNSYNTKDNDYINKPMFNWIHSLFINTCKYINN